MQNILADLYKRYNAQAWLSPMERAAVRLLKMLALTFLVGALPAVTSAYTSLSMTGDLTGFNWSATSQAMLVGGTISVLATIWKYINAKGEGTTGPYPAEESQKPLAQQISDTLAQALPVITAEIGHALSTGAMLGVNNAPGASATTQPVPAASVLPQVTTLAHVAPFPPVGTDGASDAATPNATAGQGYDGGMGAPIEEDHTDAWLLDTTATPAAQSNTVLVTPAVKAQ